MLEKGLHITNYINIAKNFKFRGKSYRCEGVVLHSKEEEHYRTIRNFGGKRANHWWIMEEDLQEPITDIHRHLENIHREGWEVCAILVRLTDSNG
jgi:hypothetical protein